MALATTRISNPMQSTFETTLPDRVSSARETVETITIALDNGSSLSRGEAMSHKAAVSNGKGLVALFDSQAEPPKPRVARQPKQRLPANWKKIRGKVLAKAKKPKPKPKPDDGTVINRSFVDGMQQMMNGGS